MHTTANTPPFVCHLGDISVAEEDLKSKKEVCEMFPCKSFNARKYPSYNKLAGSNA